ncbi:MAG: M15 family metallopeptidase [Synergistetes bacterium]|nr:M15 family metallopeptidase [Synergistota bacterium]MCX8128328.1 M15 family metallopeptidase [Synergistota bacterium]MDW8192647.1 M15 family metallopeptidase [Synergistota bacterium]
MSTSILKSIPIPIPKVEWEWKSVKSKEIRENGEKLVPLSLFPEKILVRPQYFIQGIEGALPECYAREGVYRKLIEASLLLPDGHKLVILDAWRPIKVQQSLFNILREKFKTQYPNLNEEELTNLTLKFVALPSTDPKKPSPHNTGGAIDLTIADEYGRLLYMGTEYDDSTEISRTTYFEELILKGEKLGEKEIEALQNRRLLYHILTSVGFTNYIDEWWHFDYGNQNWAWMSGKSYALYGAISPSFPWRENIR